MNKYELIFDGEHFKEKIEEMSTLEVIGVLTMKLDYHKSKVQEMIKKQEENK